MQGIQAHLRTTFLAGIFAAIPIGVTAFIIWKADELTRGISQAIFGRPIPFVGALIAIIGVYLLGLFVTLSLGKFVLRIIDRTLSRIPGLQTLYESWKQISLTPGGGEGVFARVVLIADESGQHRVMGFSSGDPIPGESDMICVFVPNAPNPIQGKLFFVAKTKVIFTPLSSEEAFKLLLSTGNYIPAELLGSK